MANLIQIKRSESTATPASLANGELAWSSNGDKLFIGDFNTVQAIGGNYITNDDGNIEVSFDTSGVTLDLANSVNITSLTLSGDEVTAISSNLDSDSSSTSLVTADAVVSYINDVSGSTTLIGLTDTNITTPADGSLLIYDADTGKWIDHEITGDASISDTGALTLETVNDDAGTFGDANTVGSFTIDVKGRITNASSVDIDHDTLLNYVSDEHIDHSNVSITTGDGLTGGGDITASRTLSVVANNGITVDGDGVFVDGANGILVTTEGVNVANADNSLSVTASGVAVNTTYLADIAVTSLTGTANEIELSNTVGDITIGLPNDVTIPQNLTVGNDLTVSGDLVVNGNTTTINVQDLFVEDALIHLASNNAADSLDIGFIGHYVESSNTEHAGLFRKASDNKFYLFTGLEDDGLDNGSTTTININDASYERAALNIGDLEANTITLETTIENGIIYSDAAGVLTASNSGSEGEVLQVGTGGIPEFGSLDGGTF